MFDDLQDIECRVLAFSGNSSMYDATVVWFGDVDMDQRKGYFIDALVSQEGEGHIYWKRFYEDSSYNKMDVGLEDVVEVDSKYYVADQEMIARIFKFTWEEE